MAPPTAANGVLPAAVLRKPDNKHSGRQPRKSAERLKVIIRRLPPGLTQSEFENCLGDDWRPGAGHINWFDYKPGKISNDFSKPSRPARAYLNVTREDLLVSLKEKALTTTFHDAKNTSKDAALIGPPALEYAPCSRVPLGKRRPDARQGTIDQDPEFIAFLESLTNPVAKPTSLDAEPAGEKEKVTTTPLIEHLREKKAAKEKAKAAKAKAVDTKDVAKTQEKTGKKGASVQAQPESQPQQAEKRTKGRMTGAERAAKQAVKVLNKEAEKVAAAVAPAKETHERKPERAPRPMNVAARIQQDLGLSPAARRARRETPPKDVTTAPAAETAASPVGAAQSPKKTQQRGSRSNAADPSSAGSPRPVPSAPAQPTLLKKPPQAPKGPAAQVQPMPPKGPKAQHPPSNLPASPLATHATLASTSSSTDPAGLPRHAFLKHANPSQGITDSLIEAALLPFGAVEKVEIDRKKGFAYVDFASNEGMRKAIAASPIKVAQGAVTVLEKRDKSANAGPKDAGGSMRGAPTGPAGMHRGGGGTFGRNSRGRGGGRGGGAGRGASPRLTHAAPVAPTTTPDAPSAGSSAPVTASNAPATAET